MNNDKLAFGDTARTKLLKGAEKLATAVAATLGPKGRNVIIQTMYANPIITKDGVTVAKHIFLEDPQENLAATIIKQAAEKTNTGAGDGTTTSTVLAHAILKEGNKFIQAGVSPIDVVRGILEANRDVQDILTSSATPVSEKDYYHVATIASNSDVEIGDIVAEAVLKASEKGAISIQDSPTPDTYLSFKPGLFFEQGLLSSTFATEKQSHKAVYEDAIIFISAEKIKNAQEAMHLLEIAAVQGNRKPLVIIAPEFESGALQMLAINRQQAGFQVLPLKAPSYGNNRQKMLEDIAAYTNSEVFSETSGYRIEDTDINFFGSLKRIETDRLFTTIISDDYDPERVDNRLKRILNEIEETKVQWEIDQLKERYSKLSGGVCVINVGAHTEAELKEKKDRIDDALHATRAAAISGILPGGGLALLKASKSLSIKEPVHSYGYRALLEAIKYPFIKIIENAGGNAGYFAAKVTETSVPYTNGVNAQTLEFADMVESGIIDPKKVVSTALNNAVSASTALLMSEVISYHTNEDVDYSKEPPTLSV